MTTLFSVHGKKPKALLPGPKIPIIKGFSKALPIWTGALSLLIIISDFESNSANSSKVISPLKSITFSTFTDLSSRLFSAFPPVTAIRLALFSENIFISSSYFFIGHIFSGL